MGVSSLCWSANTFNALPIDGLIQKLTRSAMESRGLTASACCLRLKLEQIVSRRRTVSDLRQLG